MCDNGAGLKSVVGRAVRELSNFGFCRCGTDMVMPPIRRVWINRLFSCCFLLSAFLRFLGSGEGSKKTRWAREARNKV